MADEDQRQAEFALQTLQKIEDLALDRDIERGDRLVADDELRLKDHGTRDADALRLSAGEFMRIAVDRLGAAAHARHDRLDAGAALFCLQLRPMHEERLGDDLAYRHAWIERGERILKDDLHIGALFPHLVP